MIMVVLLLHPEAQVRNPTLGIVVVSSGVPSVMLQNLRAQVIQRYCGVLVLYPCVLLLFLGTRRPSILKDDVVKLLRGGHSSLRSSRSRSHSPPKALREERAEGKCETKYFRHGAEFRRLDPRWQSRALSCLGLTRFGIVQVHDEFHLETEAKRESGWWPPPLADCKFKGGIILGGYPQLPGLHVRLTGRATLAKVRRSFSRSELSPRNKKRKHLWQDGY